MDIITLAAAKIYTDKTVIGGGAIKGKNCTIDSITAITGGHRITFKWTLDDGTEQTSTLDVMDGEKGDKGDKGSKGDTGATGANGEDGVSITEAEIDEYGHLILTFSDGDVIDAGQASEGTLVVANPDGAASGQLNKIQVGENIYSIPEGGGKSWVDVTGTLAAGQTQLSLSNPSITQDSTIDIYTDTFGVDPTDVSLSGNDHTVAQGLVTQESELDITVTASENSSDAWKAFTAGTSVWGLSESSNDAQWLEFEFDVAVSLSALTITIIWGGSNPTKLQYSTDGQTWTDATVSGYWYSDITVTNAPAKKYWRLAWTETPTKPGVTNLILYCNAYAVNMTFPEQSANLGVKVRVS